MKERIKVLIKEPQAALKVAEIQNRLETLQEIVGGYIECVSVPNDIVMIVNEEGKLRGLPPNFRYPVTEDVIVGTAIFAGVCGEDLDDCPVDSSGLLDIFLKYEERGAKQ